MRVFLAIPIQDLSHITPKIDPSLKAVKEFHLTLKFFGDVESIQPIVERLEGLKVKPFTITLEKIDVFANWNSIRVVHIPVASKELERLHQQITKRLGEIHEQEFSFKPHITLARVKKPLSPQVIESLKKFTFEPMTQIVDRLYLIKSELTLKGPEYTVVKKI